VARKSEILKFAINDAESISKAQKREKLAKASETDKCDGGNNNCAANDNGNNATEMK